ncbi:hypothetical protein CRN76_14765 [Chryseobacterium indologenes]|nr:hypothetical protein CRN76_14765 [Chryseobacterium indologenes]AYY84663.1 hypothetical protein EGX91_08960 [Chryseobacterium indologenes]
MEIKKTSSQKNMVPVQLTPQKLAKFFGEAKACWILEDFHKIKKEEKSKTSPRCAKSPDFAQKQSKVRRLRIADSFVFIIYKL